MPSERHIMKTSVVCNRNSTEDLGYDLQPGYSLSSFLLLTLKTSKRAAVKELDRSSDNEDTALSVIRPHYGRVV